jgi:hypothetical protein
MNTAQPDRPFYLWLEDVCDIIEYNSEYNRGRIDRIPFWWDLYRRNYSPKEAIIYSYDGMPIDLPRNPNKTFTQKPFPADDAPDVTVDLRLPQ